MVATPGRLLGHHQRGSLNLSNTAALVLDEVDVLAGGWVVACPLVGLMSCARYVCLKCLMWIKAPVCSLFS